ncbi:MAG: methyltransferase domain-containing protein [Alphaproteobacteria bacterium]|nr:methyltransferase domain-containing protein [Alphaproteobacteria bacterium]
MPRTPEPELMDDAAQAQAYDAADFSGAHGRRVELFRERYPEKDIDGAVLDLGCGSGDVLERFAQAFPAARFTGVDGAAAMLALAQRRMEKAGLSARMNFVRALIPSPDIPADDYAVVMSHSLLHHLHDPGVLWRTVKERAGANSFVFIADLRRPESEARAQELVDTLSAGEPEVLQQDFYNSLLAAFTAEEIRAQLDAAGLSSLAVEEVDEIHVLVHGVIA